MNVLVNKGRRRLGIPGRPAIILGAGESVNLDDAQLAFVKGNKTACRWIEAGVLELTDEVGAKKVKEVKKAPKAKIRPAVAPRKKVDDREAEELPEGVTGEGVEMHHSGGGWWQVYVNGFPVTDRKVRKDEAESIAAEYE